MITQAHTHKHTDVQALNGCLKCSYIWLQCNNHAFFTKYSLSYCLQFRSEDFQPRNRETHARHIQQLDGPLHNHIATTYGIQSNSILNSSRYFHVTEGLVMDIMHDILEGTLEYEMKELMKYLCSSGICSLNIINSKIRSFHMVTQKLAVNLQRSHLITWPQMITNWGRMVWSVTTCFLLIDRCIVYLFIYLLIYLFIYLFIYYISFILLYSFYTSNFKYYAWSELLLHSWSFALQNCCAITAL